MLFEQHEHFSKGLLILLRHFLWRKIKEEKKSRHGNGMFFIETDISALHSRRTLCMLHEAVEQHTENAALNTRNVDGILL